MIGTGNKEPPLVPVVLFPTASICRRPRRRMIIEYFAGVKDLSLFAI